MPNIDTLTEVIGPPTGKSEIYPEAITENDTQSSLTGERGNFRERERILTRSVHRESLQNEELIA